MSLGQAVARAVSAVASNPALSVALTYIERAGKTFIDPNTLEAQHPPTSEHATRGVRLRPGQKLVNGTRVKANEVGYLIAATDLAVVPTGAGLIREGTKQRKIAAVDPIELGEVTVAYKIRVQR
jgi:hypothetical protein